MSESQGEGDVKHAKAMATLCVGRHTGSIVLGNVASASNTVQKRGAIIFFEGVDSRRGCSHLRQVGGKCERYKAAWRCFFFLRAGL